MSDRGVGGRVVCAGRLVSSQPLLKDAETKRKSIHDSAKPSQLMCFTFKYAFYVVARVFF